MPIKIQEIDLPKTSIKPLNTIPNIDKLKLKIDNIIRQNFRNPNAIKNSMMFIIAMNMIYSRIYIGGLDESVKEELHLTIEKSITKYLGSAYTKLYEEIIKLQL